MEWVQALLVDVHLYAIDDGQPNLYKVDHDTHVSMSFGWTLATPDGKRIVGSKGPCNEWQMQLTTCRSSRNVASNNVPLHIMPVFERTGTQCSMYIRQCQTPQSNMRTVVVVR